MLPLKAPPRDVVRRDPAPSRLRYRLNRLWLRPRVRTTVNLGVPLLAGLLAAWTAMATLDLRARIVSGWQALHAAVVEQPQFVITRIEVPDVSADLAETIRVAAFVDLPASSLEVNVAAVRDRIESLDGVERARVRALTSGVLETNTQPGMTPTSLAPEQAAFRGISFGKLVRWMVEDASCSR